MRNYSKSTQERLLWIDKNHPTEQDVIKGEVPKKNLNFPAKPGMLALKIREAERKWKRKKKDVLDSYNKQVRLGNYSKINGRFEIGYPILLKWALRNEKKFQKATDEEHLKKKKIPHEIRHIPINNGTEFKMSIRAERQLRKDLINFLVLNLDNLPVTYHDKTIRFQELKEIMETKKAKIQALEFQRFNALEFLKEKNISIPEFLSTNLLGLDPRNKDINNLSFEAIEELKKRF